MACLSIIGMAFPLHAQQQVANFDKDFGLFEGKQPLHVELKFDIKELIKHKHKEAYQPATFRLYADDSTFLQREIQLKPRGNFRLNYCAMPPIKLNFKEVAFENPSLDRLKSIKLVTRCRGASSYEDYIIQEYLIYQMYNVLTDRSFRARLLEITYIDTEGKRKTRTDYGFVIEDVDDLAARNDCFELDLEGLRFGDAERQQLALVELFEFMIGNTDYDLNSLHNLKVIRSNDPLQEQPFIVPYDFDYSGMVDAYYAVPHESLGIDKVRERLYRGHCWEEAELQAVFDLFNAKRTALEAIYEQCAYLDEASKRKSLAYLADFFDIINSPARVRRQILSICR